MEMDIVDEQVDTVGRAFMGLTLGCARCHDHKFDPIATADYYGLAGIFKSTRTMETFKKVARWHENSLADEADLARKAAHDRRGRRAEGGDPGPDRRARTSGSGAGRRATGSRCPKKPEPLYPGGDAGRAQAAARRRWPRSRSRPPRCRPAMGVTEGQVADTSRPHPREPPDAGRARPAARPARPRPTSDAADASAPRRAAGWSWPAGSSTRDHPLTGRVMVNRIWRWHFGQGLVATPDNFGALGDRPTNPPLLDWLARRFVEAGWSVKAMHRLIMLSSTYQMGSDVRPARGAGRPGEPAPAGGCSPRRLEAEAIRDALLAVGGTLDPAMGGSLLTVKNRDYFFDHTSQRRHRRTTARRRSVYLPVVRNHLYDVLPAVRLRRLRA